LPISSMEWQGSFTDFSNPEQIKPWGEPFTLPVLSSYLEFKPVNMFRQQTPEGPATVIGILAENKGTVKETVPDFRMDGKNGQKVYHGKRVEQEAITLDPGEQRYLHYAILTDNHVSLTSLNVLTPEKFVTANQTVIDYTVGRLNIALPESAFRTQSGNRPEPYEPNQIIRFDPLNKMISPEIDVSMVELHMHEGEGAGYKTAIAKFKLHNRSYSPVPVPAFQVALVSPDGYNYLGTRQSKAAENLVPNLSYVVSYSFNVPSSETGERLIMKIMDGQSADPFHVPIAEFVTQTREESGGPDLEFYPFLVKINNWSISAQALFVGELTYSYKLRLDLDIQRQDNVVVDENFSKMKIELVDVFGRIVGSETVPFTGADRLTTGWQTIDFRNVRTEQFDNRFHVYIYESIETPFGEAKRLVERLEVK